MPRIRQFSARPVLPQPIATKQQFGSEIGDATARLGNQIEGLGEAIDDIQSDRDIGKMRASSAEKTTELNQKMRDFAQSIDPNDEDAVKNWVTENVSPFTEEFGVEARTKRGKQWAEAEKLKMQEYYTDKGNAIQHEMAGQQAALNWDRAKNAYLTNILDNPEDVEKNVTEYTEAVQSAIATGQLEMEDAMLDLRQFESQAYWAKGIGTLRLNPHQLLADLDDPEQKVYGEKLTAVEYESLRQKALNKIEGDKTAANKIDMERFKEQNRRRASTGVKQEKTRDQYIQDLSEGDAAKADAIGEQYDIAEAIGDVALTNEGKPMAYSYEETLRLQKAREGDDFDVADPGYQAQLAYTVARQEAHDEDPAGWTLQTSTTAMEMYEESQELGTPESRQEYYAVVTAEHERLAKGMKFDLMPVAEVKHIASMTAFTDTEQGPQQASAALAEIIEMSGPDYAPQVLGQLFRQEAINPTQYVAGRMMRSGDAVTAEKLMRVSNVKITDLAKDTGISGIQNAVRQEVIEEMAEHRGIFAGLPGGRAQVNAYRDAAIKLVLAETSLSLDDPRDVEDVVDRVVRDLGHPMRTYYVPSGQDPASIRVGVRQVNFEDFDLNIPPSAQDLRPEHAAEDYRTNLNRLATFVPDGREEGLFVLDGSGRRVYHKVGDEMVALHFSWNDLNKKAGEYQSAVETRAFKTAVGADLGAL